MVRKESALSSAEIRKESALSSAETVAAIAVRLAVECEDGCPREYLTTAREIWERLTFPSAGYAPLEVTPKQPQADAAAVVPAQVVYVFDTSMNEPVTVLGPPGLDMWKLQTVYADSHPDGNFLTFRQRFVANLCEHHHCISIENVRTEWQR